MNVLSQQESRLRNDSPNDCNSFATIQAFYQAKQAVMDTWFGSDLPSRFADKPLAEECAAARKTVCCIDANYLALAWLEGPDRIRYLNAVLTSNIKDLTPGQGAQGLLLNPQGHILAEVFCYAFSERILVATHASARQRAFETLEKFIIMDDATLRDVTGDFVAFAVEGPKADELLQSFFQVNLSSLPAHGHTEVHWKPENTSVSLLVVARSQAGLPGAVLLVPQVHGLRLMCALVKAVSQFGGTIIGWEALNALRLESGIPWFGYDFDERTIPHEAGLEISHISYTKGCYTGQEIVERVRSRGHVNRRLTRLKFSGAVNPAAGTKLFASEKEIGHVTSAAFSPAMGQPIGLGFVRREHIAHGTRLAWEGGEAEVFVAG